ncbi:hypothetical protein J2X57_000529 [Luteibacter sp. 1214]|uniref:hypothetical protein n=1 Tax=Luteibacter sp. 1214 TaxID=2817735 RepID=UPI0028579C83|nr:hypothetical protein [Luteibacter sp. 1214]MDR6641335.1 hypothetical protein [Luteibacter sp. 1214]
MTSAQGISFEIKPSATLTVWLVLVVCLATLAPLFTSLPLFACWSSMAVIGVFGMRRVRRYRHPRLRRLHWAVDGVWSVTDRRGLAMPAELFHVRRVGLAMFLRFRWRGGAGHVLLMPDSTSTEHLRLLRGRLKRA